MTIQGTYDQCEPYIEDGDIVFIRSTGSFIHRLIHFFTQSPHVHVGVACWVTIKDVKILLIFDTNGGTRRRVLSLSHFRDHDMDVIVAPTDWNEMVCGALDRLGHREYSWLQAAYIGMCELIEKFCFIKLPMLDFGDDSEVCSKFIAELIQLEHTNVSPACLYKMLLNNGSKKRAEIR